ncbi:MULTISPECIES: DNA cytosine methyltransferase [unclassified Rhizobium]|uniref:DNA cytosine methyltransferase n=1 Tax=unclassified Rhizobium TaxID=2613769 RepID=UPI001ADAC856|nr:MULTISPECIES: DNA (cytosine-5-)-methyltransferase [unclassified Rhizobium]MBO9127938.1 DNA (cytosine-5-)-methyltransferase [Rhizobium sp. 16-488-2b]MBO9178515.1 DNA (cytosine-5-)-methyltransferase [Rhizobium sp. 16-488-2a]
MTKIDMNAKALSDARKRILKIQEAMTARVLEMAAEVEKLMAIVPVAEAKHFLKARCNLPARELSSYVGFAHTLKGSEEVLRKSRASFPVVKALVAADAETRREVIERMQIGAQVDTKDVAAIRRRLAEAKLSVSDIQTAVNKKIVATAAQTHVKATITSFERRVSSFSEELRLHCKKGSSSSAVVQTGLRHEAGNLLAQFTSLFGDELPAVSSFKSRSSGYWMARAHEVLRDFANGTLTEIGPQHTSSLQVVSGKSRILFDGRWRKALTAPPKAFAPRVIELCAGAGGLALGLERAGFEHVALIERDKHAAATLRKNRPDWNVIEADIRQIDYTQYRTDNIDLLAGGLPCTPFSTVGEKKGKLDENDLLMEGVRAVYEIRPKAFLFENVEGLLHARHADYVAALLQKLAKAGYETTINRINTRDYGVAQDRSRIMIVGFQKNLDSHFVMPPKFPQLAKNMGDVLADLMGANGWTGADAWVRMMRERPEQDRFGRSLGTGALSDTIRKYQGSPQEGEARRAKKNGVSYAPPAKSAPTNEDAAKPGFLPGLTTRMRARLQDFPDNWHFTGGLQSVTDQIGNAVAPAVGHAMGLALSSALKDWQFDWSAIFEPVKSGNRQRVDAPSIAAELNLTASNPKVDLAGALTAAEA